MVAYQVRCRAAKLEIANSIPSHNCLISMGRNARTTVYIDSGARRKTQSGQKLTCSRPLPQSYRGLARKIPGINIISLNFRDVRRKWAQGDRNLSETCYEASFPVKKVNSCKRICASGMADTPVCGKCKCDNTIDQPPLHSLTLFRNNARLSLELICLLQKERPSKPGFSVHKP